MKMKYDSNMNVCNLNKKNDVSISLTALFSDYINHRQPDFNIMHINK